MLSKLLFRLNQVIRGQVPGGYDIKYNGNVRNGEVYYSEGTTKLCFHQELGGGTCMMYIDVPSKDKWEQLTHTPLSRRKEILDRVGQYMQKLSASDWNYEVQDDMIYFFK